MADKVFKSFGDPKVAQLLHNHTIYLQACVNYIGRQLGWRRYVRLAFFTAVTVAAFRSEVVDLYFFLRTLVF
jgi:hypothetical protein